MKLKNILISCGLALAMGLGVGASLLSAKNFKEAKADDPEITYKKYYFDYENPKDQYDFPWWANAGAKTYMYAYNDADQTLKNAPWPGQEMSLYGTFTSYLEVDSRLDRVIFTRVNPENTSEVWNRTSTDPGISINLPNNSDDVQCFVLKAAFDGNYYDGNASGDWIQYEFEVDTYVRELDNSVTTGHQTVIYNQYPTIPTIAYGTTFHGWFLDDTYHNYANWEGYNGETYSAVYGYISESRTYNLLYDFTDMADEIGLTSSHRLKLHQSNTAEDEFYYVNIDSSFQGSFTCYESTLISFDPDVYVEIQHNYNCGISSAWNSYRPYDTLIVKKYGSGTATSYSLEWKSYTDAPSADGYYVVNTETGLRFDHMSDQDARITSEYKLNAYNQDGYVAVYRGYQAAQGESIFVRSYANNTPTLHSLDNDEYYFQSKYPQTWMIDNVDYTSLTFRVAGLYDIYMRSNGTFHVELNSAYHGALVKYTLFHPAYVGVDTEYDFFIVAPNEVFDPDLESEHDFDKNLYNEATGLWTGELYTDAECTQLWQNTTLSADITLYAKCYEDGAYLIGDAAFSGSAAAAWTLDAGHQFVEVASGNERFDEENMIYYAETILEAEAVIPSTTTSSAPTQVGTLLLLDMFGGYEQYLQSPIFVDFTLDRTYDFATIDNSVTNQMKLTFTRGGEFTLRANVNLGMHLDQNGHPNGQLDLDVVISLVQDDDSLDTFVANFLSTIGGICKTDNTTDLEALATAWGQQKVAFNALSEGDKAIIRAVGFNGGNENGNNIDKLVAKYAHIINRYGTDTFEDFIFNGVHSSPKVGLHQTNMTNSVIIIAVLVSSALILTIGLKFFYMKKKER